MASPAVYDVDTIAKLGIDPKTVIRRKHLTPETQKEVSPLKEGIKKQLRIVDEQNAIRRYVWYNLPKGLSTELIERILYYRGQGIFFYIEALDEYFFLPYTLNGTIDVYGRFTEVRPLPFNGKSEIDEKDLVSWLQNYTKTPVYEAMLPEDFLDEETGEFKLEEMAKAIKDSCVIIRDYTQQMNEMSISRQILQEPLIDVMSEMIPFCKTALLNATGVQGIKIPSEQDSSNILAASASINRAALTQQKFIPIVGSLEMQELTSGNVAKGEEFMLAMQSLDNYRLSLYGLDNGGLFQKHSHILEAEQEMNQGNVGLILEDGLLQRQAACDIINSIWGLGVWCDVSETVIGIDRNMDGVIGDQMDQSGEEEGNQPAEEEVTE